MGYDRKYGHVTLENREIPDDEGLIVFRYRDAETPAVMERYLELCEQADSPEHHLALIRETIADVQAWQDEHRDRVVTPTSNALLG